MQPIAISEMRTRSIQFRRRGNRNVVARGVLATLLAGCAAGPNFVPPAQPVGAAYTPRTTARQLAAGDSEPSQRLVVNQAIPATWWTLFRSPALDSLVQSAIASSPTTEAARARLAEAQEGVIEERGALYPQIDAGALAERQKGPPFALGLLRPRPVPTFNLYAVGPTASYAPDVFGLTARRVEEKRALAETQAYQFVAAQLAVTGNAVTAALTIASIRLQIDALEDLTADDERNRALVRQRLSAGRAARTDELMAAAQLANDRLPLPPFRQQVAVAENALAVLVGRSPGEWTPPAFTLADFTLPAELPVSLPSALVHQRPDILAAEAELHASSAAIGIATGRLYPTITLSGSLEPAALATGALFDGSSVLWNLAAGITTPIFHGGVLAAQKRAAIDGFHASLATYQQTVLEAFGQVANILRALSHDADLLAAERQALDASRAALALQRLRYAAGKINMLELLAADRSYQQARLGYARAEGQRFLDSAQLVVALGGGWWDDPSLCGDCRARSDSAGKGASASPFPSLHP